VAFAGGHNARNTQFHATAKSDDYRTRGMIATVEEEQADVEDEEIPPDSSSSSSADGLS
jgi:hypothetical protein